MRTLITGAIRAAGAISPRLGAVVSLPLFMHVGRPRPVVEADAVTMTRARRSAVRVRGVDGRGADVTVYEWGAGARTVVLAHGWQGRASQFATLVRDLAYEGYHVVAFDAPAHGESAGRYSYLFDWIDVLRELQRREGRFHAVVGHSFGALAALVAVADGVVADNVVAIAAPADADTLLTQFQTQVGFDDRTAAALRTRFERRFFADVGLDRISAARRPLPSATRLLVVHDVGDRRVPYGEARRLADANPGTLVVSTEGLGHSRILTADSALDAILSFLDVSHDLSERQASMPTHGGAGARR